MPEQKRPDEGAANATKSKGCWQAGVRGAAEASLPPAPDYNVIGEYELDAASSSYIAPTAMRPSTPSAWSGKGGRSDSSKPGATQ